MMNYEKQILIIDIKINRHCSICKISLNKRQNLIKKWKYRTHEYIQTKFAKQHFCSKHDLKKNDNHMIIHLVINWIWKYEFCNAHTLINIDILHQLFKGIVIRLTNWIIALIDEMLTKDNQDFKERLKKWRKKEKNII